MPPLPPLLTRPPAVLDEPASAPPGSPPDTVLDTDLTTGVPTRLALDATRALVLAVPLGTARALLSLDPLAPLVDTRVTAGEPVGAARARLTLVVGTTIADTAPVVPGVRFRLASGTTAAVEVVVDLLVLTAGTLRSPGPYGSRITLRWRPLDVAPLAGPQPARGDPGIPAARLGRGGLATRGRR